MKEKKRLDKLLLERRLEQSRERCQALIMAGDVYVNGEKVTKPGQQVECDAEVEIRSKGLLFVSRGGLKLEKGLDEFKIDLSGRVCMDVGASTGGFTHCMMLRGASKVFAVDVGYGQLAWELRNDPRVVVLERTNARYITSEQVPDPLDFAAVDVSFISLKLVLPAVCPLLKEDGEMVVLVKPQFEAGKELVGKKGVVRDPAVHAQILHDVKEAVLKMNLSVLGLTFSPIRGPEGNIEFLYHLQKKSEPSAFQQLDIDRIVNLAHLSFEE